MLTVRFQPIRHPLWRCAPLLLLLGGCSSMSQNECATADWRTVGYEDGVNGYPGDRIAQHRKDCAKYGVTTNLDLYQQGRQQGLLEFCQPANGYRVGVQGRNYYGVCPAALEPKFMAAFDSGHQLYVLQSRVSNADAQIQYKRSELDRLEHGIAANAVQVASNDTTAQDRADALLNTEQSAERIGRLKAEIHQLEIERVNNQHELDSYQANHAPVI
jgi:uncharacterized small protein (DUF1192 family)